MTSSAVAVANEDVSLPAQAQLEKLCAAGKAAKAEATPEKRQFREVQIARAVQRPSHGPPMRSANSSKRQGHGATYAQGFFGLVPVSRF